MVEGGLKLRRERKDKWSLLKAKQMFHLISTLFPWGKGGVGVLGGDDSYLPGFHFLLGCPVTGDLRPLAPSSLDPFLPHKISHDQSVCAKHKWVAEGKRLENNSGAGFWKALKPFWPPGGKCGCLPGPRGKHCAWMLDAGPLRTCGALGESGQLL